jgi:hypothetical protein
MTTSTPASCSDRLQMVLPRTTDNRSVIALRALAPNHSESALTVPGPRIGSMG